MGIFYFLLLIFCITFGHSIKVQSRRNSKHYVACVDEWVNRKPELLNEFSRSQLSWLCESSLTWQNSTQVESKNSNPRDTLTRKQKTWLNLIQTCTTISCLHRTHRTKCHGGNCKAADSVVPPATHSFSGKTLPKIKPRPRKADKYPINNGSSDNTPAAQMLVLHSDDDFDTRTTRKEYRQMADTERLRLHKVLNKLKTETIHGKSKYDLLINAYSGQESPEARWGPAFLPFHRELLKQLEMAMRQIDPETFIPYWDSTLDEGLPDPKHSIVWSEDFFGTANGEVTTGPFADWLIIKNVGNRSKLLRDVGSSPIGRLYTERDWEFALTRQKYADFTACLDPTFELKYALMQLYVGGSMAQVSNAPADPMFFLHHCFTDYMWEGFRQIKQTEEQREIEYPPNDKACNSHHYGSSQMLPFLLRNADGLNNNYTTHLYQYYPRPTCSDTVPNCASKYLFCDSKEHRCLSKVMMGGNCTGFQKADICYQGICSEEGICIKNDKAKDEFSTETLKLAATKAPIPHYTHTVPRESLEPTATSSIKVPTSRIVSATTTTSGYSTSQSQPSKPVLYVSATPYTPAMTTTHPEIEKSTTQQIEHSFLPPPPVDTGKPTDSESAAFPVVWFTITIIRGSIYFKTPVPGATVKSTGLNVPTGYTQQLSGSKLQSSVYPHYKAGAFVQVMDPKNAGYSGLIKAAIEVHDETGQPCQAYCYRASTMRYTKCDNRITVSTDRYYGDPIEFRATQNEALTALWKADDYRKQRIPDYLMFKCEDKKMQFQFDLFNT